MQTNSNALIILTKFPKSSVSKTRLIPDIGPEVACRVSEMFTVDLLRRFVDTSHRIIIAGASADTEDDFIGLLEKHNIPVERVEIFLPRSGSMMGDIAASYQFALTTGSRKAMLTATDIPYLSCETVEKAFAALDSVDVVMFPNVDGTICPQAIKKFVDLFSGMNATALESWCERVHMLNLTCYVFDPIFDIDRISDLKTFYHWQRFLRHSNNMSQYCPETMKLLNVIFQ